MGGVRGKKKEKGRTHQQQDSLSSTYYLIRVSLIVTHEISLPAVLIPNTNTILIHFQQATSLILTHLTTSEPSPIIIWPMLENDLKA